MFLLNCHLCVTRTAHLMTFLPARLPSSWSKGQCHGGWWRGVKTSISPSLDWQVVRVGVAAAPPMPPCHQLSPSHAPFALGYFSTHDRMVRVCVCVCVCQGDVMRAMMWNYWAWEKHMKTDMPKMEKWYFW